MNLSRSHYKRKRGSIAVIMAVVTTIVAAVSIVSICAATQGESQTTVPPAASQASLPVAPATPSLPEPTVSVQLPAVFVARVAQQKQTNERDEALLHAIRDVESHDNPRKIGRIYRERGAYQFRHGTWVLCTDLPFRYAHTDAAHDVARIHLANIKTALERGGKPLTPKNLAMAWNAGAAAVVRNSVPRKTRSYAERVCNLYQVYVAEASAAKVADKATPLYAANLN